MPCHVFTHPILNQVSSKIHDVFTPSPPSLLFALFQFISAFTQEQKSDPAFAASFLARLSPHARAELFQCFEETQMEAHIIFTEMDLDHDGSISEDEYVRYHVKKYPRISVSKSSNQASDETDDLRSHSDMVRQQFRAMDANHDGVLTPQEYARFYTNHFHSLRHDGSGKGMDSTVVVSTIVDDNGMQEREKNTAIEQEGGTGLSSGCNSDSRDRKSSSNSSSSGSATNVYDHRINDDPRSGDHKARAHIEDNDTTRDPELVPRPPRRDQLRSLFVQQSIPFVGFGFLDNLVMICAGDYIDTTVGVTLGITTMAAAGLGNACSDVVGKLFGETLEVAATKMGLPVVRLTHSQMQLPITRAVSMSAGCMGLTVGCILGMFPLLL